jgi:hypothetical protein
MKTNHTKNIRGAVFALLMLTAIFAAIFPAQAQAQSDAPPADQWKFSITPYLWLPNINGTLKYSVPPGTGSPEIETGPNDYLQNLKAVIMISGEVRKDRWSVFTDLIYLELADEESSVKSVDFGGSLASSSLNLSTSSTLRGTAWTLGAGYDVQTGPAVTLDVFGGLRYFELAASTDWQLAGVITGPGGGQTFPRTGGISEKVVLWDGIVGVRGRVPLGGSHWSIPYYLDLGAGSSQLTWQWLLGIDYSFKWGGVTLAYRDLYYDQKDDKLLQNLRFSGPALGVTFRF